MVKFRHLARDYGEAEGGDISDRRAVKHQVVRLLIANRRPQRHDCLLLTNLRASKLDALAE